MNAPKKFRAYVIIPFLMQLIFRLPVLTLMRVFGQFKVEGLDKILTVEGPVIIAANHPNQIDPALIRIALPQFCSKTPLFWLVRSFKSYGWTGWRKYVFTDAFFLAWGAPIAPSGLKNYALALKEHVRVIYDGYSMNIFPQAGDEKLLGKDAPIHGGIAYVAHATGAPIIPTAVIGSRGFTFGRLFAGKMKLKVVFGDPIPVEALRLMSDENVTIEEYKDAARKIMKAVYAVYDGASA